MSDLINPEILRGTRDFLPEDMAKRNYVMNKIREVFKIFGYDTIETPAIEYLSTLLGQYGEEGNKLLYRFEDNGGRKVALRYDQTVPFARVVAANYQNLPMPFKRYEINRVWRADRPAKGRYREFYQCDADVIGTNSLVADGEAAKILYRVFHDLGFSNFIIKFNSRQLINKILESVGIPESKQVDAIRILDKIDKIGRDAVEAELSELTDQKKARALLDVVLLSGSNSEKVRATEGYGVSEVAEFLDICKAYEIPEKNLAFDLSLARGLDYYTGIVYEVILPDIDIGSVCGGGRYDNLCGRFCKEKFSGVGFALGFDRIVVAMETKGLLKNIRLNTEVLVTYFSPDTLRDSLRILNALQEANIPCEIYFDPTKLQKQMKYADKKGIPFVIFCGPEEAAKKEVRVKMMKTGKEKTLPENQLVGYLQGFHRESA